MGWYHPRKYIHTALTRYMSLVCVLGTCTCIYVVHGSDVADVVTPYWPSADVIQVLLKLPVSVAALKQGNMGKLIKQLSKQEHPGQVDILFTIAFSCALKGPYALCVALHTCMYMYVCVHVHVHCCVGLLGGLVGRYCPVSWRSQVQGSSAFETAMNRVGCL